MSVHITVSRTVTGIVIDPAEYSALLLATAEHYGLGASKTNRDERLAGNSLADGWLLNRRRKKFGRTAELVCALDQVIRDREGRPGGTPSSLRITVNEGFDNNFYPADVNPASLASSGRIAYEIYYRAHPYASGATGGVVFCTIVTNVSKIHELALHNAHITLPDTPITQACLGEGGDYTRQALADMGVPYAVQGPGMELTLTRKQLGTLAAYGATITGEVSGHGNVKVEISPNGSAVFTQTTPVEPEQLTHTGEVVL